MQVMPRTRRTTPFDFELNLNARWTMALVVAGLLLYVGLAWLNWQAFVPLAWLRFGVAWLLLLAPGLLLQQLLWREVSPSQRLAVGFGVSVALGGFFGLIATVFNTGLWFVLGAFTLVTFASAILLAARHNWEWKLRWRAQVSFSSLALLAPLALACLVALRLTYGVELDNDDFTYNAYVTHWLEAARFDWQQVPLDVVRVAPSRFWLAYWTLNQALLAKWSALHPIDLTRFYLSPALALIALLATYALARAFDLSRAVSVFAVTMQTVALLLLSGQDQAGLVFFNRLVEDKTVAAFILIPLWVIVATAYIRQPTRGRLMLVGLMGMALLFTHPTLMAFGAAAVALFVIFSSLPNRAWRELGALLLVVGAALSVPLAMRLFDSGYTDKIPFAMEALRRDDQLRRVLQWGGAFYSVHPNLFVRLPFLWLLVSASAALFEWKSSFAARWILAATILFISVINPLTAWLWGIAVGSSQTWRALWLLPFGLAAAYLARAFWLSRWRRRVKNVAPARAALALAVCSTLLLLGALVPLQLNAKQSDLHALRPTQVRRENDYAKLRAFKSELDAQLAHPTVVVGATRWLNDRLPTLSANARVFVFRITASMWKLNNLEWRDARARSNARRKLVAATTSAAERMAILRQYKVEYIVAMPGTTWINQLLETMPEQFQAIDTASGIKLYRVQP